MAELAGQEADGLGCRCQFRDIQRVPLGPTVPGCCLQQEEEAQLLQLLLQSWEFSSYIGNEGKAAALQEGFSFCLHLSVSLRPLCIPRQQRGGLSEKVHSKWPLLLLCWHHPCEPGLRAAEGRQNSVLKPCRNQINSCKGQRHVFFNPCAIFLINFKGLLWATEVLGLPKYLVKYEAKPWIRLLSFVQAINPSCSIPV